MRHAAVHFDNAIVQRYGSSAADLGDRLPMDDRQAAFSARVMNVPAGTFFKAS